jgi:hypothetical protein
MCSDYVQQQHLCEAAWQAHGTRTGAWEHGHGPPRPRLRHATRPRTSTWITLLCAASLLTKTSKGCHLHHASNCHVLRPCLTSRINPNPSFGQEWRYLDALRSGPCALHAIARDSDMPEPAPDAAAAAAGPAAPTPAPPRRRWRIFGSALPGAAGHFTRGQLAALAECLPQGALKHVELDHKVSHLTYSHMGGDTRIDQRVVSTAMR